jgi:hypothetical protein
LHIITRPCYFRPWFHSSTQGDRYIHHGQFILSLTQSGAAEPTLTNTHQILYHNRQSNLLHTGLVESLGLTKGPSISLLTPPPFLHHLPPICRSIPEFQHLNKVPSPQNWDIVLSSITFYHTENKSYYDDPITLACMCLFVYSSRFHKNLGLNCIKEILLKNSKSLTQFTRAA